MSEYDLDTMQRAAERWARWPEESGMQKYNKFLMGLIGVVGTGLSTFGVVPEGVVADMTPLVSALLSSILVYAVPNKR